MSSPMQVFTHSFRQFAQAQFIQAAKLFLVLMVSTVGVLFSPLLLAQDAAKITPFTDSDKRFFEKQRASINDLAKLHLGKQLRNQTQSDLQILQELLDKKIVTKDNILQLQAMGVVLGDLYVKELGVRWVVYSDSKGRSRALQWSNSKHVLFPVTMISRRVKAGVNINMNELFNKGIKVLARVVKDENRRKMLNIK